MNKRLIAYARFFISAFAMSIVFTLVNADPFTSTDANGTFDSTPSVPPQSRHSTDIDIPRHASHRFEDHSSRPPFNPFATGIGNIDTAIPARKEANSLWLKSPDSLSFSGWVNETGNRLSSFANGINMSGNNNLQTGGPGSATSSGISPLPSSTTNGNQCVSTTSTICPTTTPPGSSNNSGSGGSSIILGGIGGGGGFIFVGSSNSSNTGGANGNPAVDSGFIPGDSYANLGGFGTPVSAPVPEAGEWTMISLGLFVMLVVSRLRNQKFYPS